MELIDRYLHAVQFWLPMEQKADIIAELSEDIHSQIEEQETALGRKLTDAEIESMLKRRGRPVLVATRYLPQQYLIGPQLYPIYLLVLKISFFAYLLPWLLVWTTLMVYRPDIRSTAPGSMWGSFWFTAFVTAGMVTLVFAVLERVQAKSHFMEEWNPRKLPAVRNPNVILRVSSAIEFAANTVFFVWFAFSMATGEVVIYPDAHLFFSPLWKYFYWGFLLVALGNTVLATFNLMRPHWTALRASFRLLLDLAGSALFCWLLSASIITSINVAGVSAARAQELTRALNWWMAKMYPAAIVFCVVMVCVNAYRVVRLKKSA